MNLFRTRKALALSGWFGASLLAAMTASAAEKNLITTRIDTAQRSALPGQHVAWAAPANDRGKVATSMALSSLQLTLKRSPERQAAFDALLARQQDPASPDYRRWLTPTEIGERFGATQADIDAISTWLISQGLHVESISNSRTSIRFGGSAADVGRAFGTELHWYAGHNAKNRMAPDGEPRIPAALSNAVAGVIGLSEVRFEPQFHVGKTRIGNVDETRPALTNCGSTPCSYYVTPGDFARIYGVLGATEQGFDGTGQTIAILGRARVSDADLQSFGARLGITLPTPTVVIPPDGTDPGPAATSCSDTDLGDGHGTCDKPSDLVKDQGEATLDVTRASSVALGANIKLVVSGKVGNNDGLIYTLDHAINEGLSIGSIISISFGSCEADNSLSVASALDDAFAQAAMQGQSVFVSSGDGGAGDCEDYFTAPVAGATRSTNIFCASGHVTCVGGTSFGVGTNNNQYWNSTNQSGYTSAKGYIPEGAWNQPLNDDGTTTVAGTGGGVSTYIAKPTWQTGAGVPGNQGRYVPDVSFDASTEYGYFGCMAASNGASCVPATTGPDKGTFHFLAWGGTSASAPSMAGVAAMLNQKNGAAQGNLNPTLYALAANSANGVFHDITIASSGVTNCSVNTASLCNNSLPSPTSLTGGLAGYLVGNGYDPVTGLGSINVTNLLTHWSDAPANSIATNQRGLSGAWADPTTSSQGFVMDIEPDFYGAGTGLLFAGWYTFDVTAAGGQRWYTLQAQVSGTTPVSAGIYSTTGGRFDSTQTATAVQVGHATLGFSDCAHGTLDYAFTDGSNRRGSIPLTRLLSNTTCTPTGDSGVARVPTLLSGAWADPGNSGQGLVFDMNANDNVIFAGWYTFSANGALDSGAAAQRWYTLQATFKPGTNTPNGVGIYESTGGVFNATGTAQIAKVGSGTLVFNSCTSATLQYTFTSGANNGKSGTLDLSRLTPAPAGCTN
jgi:hypothetical protein